MATAAPAAEVLVTAEQYALDTSEQASVERLQSRLDELELAMVAAGRTTDFELVHRWVPGMYIREIHMPAGSLLTSKIHNTEHPYVVTVGRVSVLIPGQPTEHIAAPHFGITSPGTRRLLLIHESTTWITFHPITAAEYEARNVDLVEQRIIERREIQGGLTAFELTHGGLQHALPSQLDYGGAP